MILTSGEMKVWAAAFDRAMNDPLRRPRRLSQECEQAFRALRIGAVNDG